MNVLYQNNITGKIHEISSLISSAKISTKRCGSAGSLSATVLDNDDIEWVNGGIISVRDDSYGGLFYGYVFKLSQTEKETVSVTAYDGMRYLKNKDTYVFEKKRADQIISMIAADYGIRCGTMINTGYVIPSLICDGKTLFDIALKAIDLTLINTGEMFYLWDNFGSLALSDIKSHRLNLMLGNKSLLSRYSYESEIDSETKNKIKLARDNKKAGKRDIYIFEDSNNISRWGMLSEYETVDESLTASQITERGNAMLELYNRPKTSFKLTAILNLAVRAGRSVYVDIADICQSGWFIVEECTQDLCGETMELMLKAV